MLLGSEQLLSLTQYSSRLPAGNNFGFLPGLGVEPRQGLFVQAAAVYYGAFFKGLMEVRRALSNRKRYCLHEGQSNGKMECSQTESIPRGTDFPVRSKPQTWLGFACFKGPVIHRTLLRTGKSALRGPGDQFSFPPLDFPVCSPRNRTWAAFARSYGATSLTAVEAAAR